MAIFGIDATYARGDVYDEFLALGAACVEWREPDAPPLYAILRSIKAGDLIYIKSFNPGVGLTIKAVGVVSRGEVRDYGRTGTGVPVRWAWQGGYRIDKLDDKYPVRAAMLYEEYHPTVQSAVIALVLDRRPPGVPLGSRRGAPNRH
jgi:hypothetical protein